MGEGAAEAGLTRASVRSARGPGGPVRVVAAAFALLLAMATGASAQDLEPRAYSNTPVGMNFLVAGYAYSTGGVATDPSVDLEDAKVDLHLGVLAYARSFALLGQSAKFDLIVPGGNADGRATYQGVLQERRISGFADPRVRVSWNVFGAPALGLKEWREWKQDVLVGTSLQVSVPVGQYNRDRLLNLGTNRWFFKPEVAVSKAWGSLTVELSAAATLYTDNDEFLGSNTRSQEPLWATQAHVVYSFLRGAAWAAVDVTWYGGGQTSLNGVEKDDRQSNTRVGGTIAIPLGVHHSVKLYGSTGATARTGTDFDTVGVAWQYRWGGGLEELDAE